MAAARRAGRPVRRPAGSSCGWARVVAGLLCLGMVAGAGAAVPQGDALSTATGLLRAGKYDDAIAELQRALRTHAGDARLMTVEAMAYSMKGDDAEALRVLDRALRADPKLIAAWRVKAQIEVREHQPEAIPVLETILRLDPGDATAGEMLAVEQARTGACDAAIERFGQMGAAIDGHGESLLGYGSCLFRRGKNAEAAAAFGKLVELDPKSANARYDLALAQVRAGDNKGALVTLTPVLGEGADGDSLSLAAEAAEATGDTPRAVALLRQAIVLAPTVPDSYVRFAELCMEHESYEAGVEMVSAGLARLPRDPALYLARGMLYGGEADYGKAEADFHAAESFDPKHGTGAYGVGLVQAQGNHTEDALKTVREALRAHPEDGQLNLLLGRLLIEGGALPGTPEFGEALKAAETAVRLRPELTAAHNLLSKAYMMEGETARSIAECKASLKLDPEDMVAMYRLMLESRKAGDTVAVEDLTRKVAEGHRKAREGETDRLRYRIVGAPPESSPKP